MVFLGGVMSILDRIAEALEWLRLGLLIACLWLCVAALFFLLAASVAVTRGAA